MNPIYPLLVLSAGAGLMCALAASVVDGDSIKRCAMYFVASTAVFATAFLLLLTLFRSTL